MKPLIFLFGALFGLGALGMITVLTVSFWMTAL